MANQVVLTFAGEGQQLKSTFADVGMGAQQMADDSHRASMRMADGFDYASSQSSMLSGGIGDVGGALTAAFGEDSGIGQLGAEMERYGAIVMGVTGIMDLALFATNNLKLATMAKAAADRVAAGAQWLLNAAQLASPTTWIIIGIVALIAVIVLIAKRTDWFSKAWGAAWGWIKKSAQNVWNWLKQIPGWTRDAFGKIGNYILAPYKWAFNQIARAWNSTVGRLSWTVPGWIPFIGGNTVSVPNLPTFHAGGRVPGAPGQNVVAMLQAGERVTNAAGAGSDREEWVRLDMGELGEALLGPISRAVGRRGGSVTALGVRVTRTGVVV